MHTLKHVPFAQTMILKDLVEYREHRIVSLALSAEESTSLVLFALDRGESISAEFSTGLEMIAVLEGSLEVSIGEDAFLLKEGDIVAVPPNAPHAVKAEERCKFIQIGVE